MTGSAGAGAPEALTQLRSALRRWCWSRKYKAGNVQEAGCILARMGSFEWNHCLGYSRWSEEGLLSGKQGEVRAQKAQSGR